MNINKILRQAKDKKTDFSRMYEATVEHTMEGIHPPREVYLRPSMLPTCPMILADMIQQVNNNEWSSEDFGGAFFTTVGTTVHELNEKWVPHSGYKLWGNWKCPRCDAFWKHTHKNKCRKCKVTAKYMEIELEYGGFKGHIDCILITKKGILIGDYKTATLMKLGKRFKDMNPAYALQIYVYCIMLSSVWGKHFKEKYGKSVYGASLLFISRDIPFSHKEFHFPLTASMNRYTRILMANATIGLELAKEAVELDDYSRLHKHKECKSRLDYIKRVRPFFVFSSYLGLECDCPLVEMCFKPDRIEKYLRKRIL